MYAKKFLLTLVASISATFLSLAHAQSGTWPTGNKPITIIVPVSAGGNVDGITRLIGQKLSDRLKHPVVIDNIPGAGGVLGVSKALQATPDGYTLVMGFDGAISVAQHINPAVKYRAEKDLMPIGLVNTAPVVLVTRPDSQFKSLDALIEAARQKPDTLTYATSGIGTVHHLAMELLQHKAQVRLVHVPYKGGAQIANDVLGGQVDMGLLVTSSAIPFVANNKLNALGVSSDTRSPALPTVPAFSESPKLPQFGIKTWVGLFGLAGTDPQIITRLHQELKAVLELDEVRQYIENGGAEVTPSTPDSFSEFLKREQETYIAIIKAANITQ